MVAHAEEFAQQTAQPSVADIPGYVEMMKHNGAWLTATLSLDERLLEQTKEPSSLRTRPEIRMLLPEMRDLVLNHNPYVAAASPQRIEYLKQIVEFNRECGTVEVGKRADLILLEADPLADISNSRRIFAVILGGRYLPRAMLDRRLAALAAR